TPRRPGRPIPGKPAPGRPLRSTSSAAPRRQPPPLDEEVLEGEEEFVEEAPPKPQMSVAMMVGLGAAVLIAILIGVMVLGNRGFLIEVENRSVDPILKIHVIVNGESYNIGDLGPNEIGSEANARPSPGTELVVEYELPNRGKFRKKCVGNPLDFADFKSHCRILLQP